MYLPLQKVLRELSLEQIEQNIVITGAKIDSRRIEFGDLFVALNGEHVDGHDYIQQAREAGAVAALVSEKQSDALPQIVCDDVSKTFADITAYWRQQTTAKVVAITGSNGKTSVKEMVAAILREVGSVTSTQGNLNNELGVPLTLSHLSKDDEFAVIEMGANHHGEIANLVAIAKPDISLINNVAPAHIEGFGSLEGVAQAKGEIFAGLSEQGTAIVNADMPYEDIWESSLSGKRVITFALEAEADITAKDIQLDAGSSHFMAKINDEYHYINLPVPGRHNIANALAAIAVSHALNIPVESITAGLSEMHGVPHRLQIRAAVNSAQIIDDTYNANPASYKQALATLKGMTGKHWLVLGDFGELGEQSEAIHRQMGIDAKAAGVSKLFVIGEQSHLAAEQYGDDAERYTDINSLEQRLRSELSENVTCLIKGSRFMQLDKLADALAITGEG
jgi:UDP-N-acetylmuramoyl-tripeptide--D-alanyl-D-alanine ligase